MPYTTKARVLSHIDAKTLASLLDDTSQRPDIDATDSQAVFDELIRDADVYINDQLAGITDLPVTDADVLTSLERAARVYVIYSAYARRGLSGQDSPYYDRMQKVDEWFRLIRKGEANLPASDGSVVRPQTVKAVFRSDDARYKLDDINY